MGMGSSAAAAKTGTCPSSAANPRRNYFGALSWVCDNFLVSSAPFLQVSDMEPGIAAHLL
jgi:hypothetical protein